METETETHASSGSCCGDNAPLGKETIVKDTTLITVSPTAINKVVQFIKEEKKENAGLRVYVAGGGCSGLTYGMALEDSESDDDIVTENDGLRIFIDPVSAKYLKGCSVDYKESLEGSGFKINNPNVVSTCGCGHSFQTS